MRISDWSSDVCSSDLLAGPHRPARRLRRIADHREPVMTSSESELTIDRLIAAPPSAVWDAWSTPAKLEKWWIPAPIACRVIALDLRPSGGFETQMREGSGDVQPHIDGCFLDVKM